MLTALLFNTFRTRLQTNYKGGAKAIPWAILIPMLMEMLAGCFPAPPTAAAVNSAVLENEDYLETMVRVELRREHGFLAWKRYDGAGIMASIKETAKEADDTIVSSIYACCA